MQFDSPATAHVGTCGDDMPTPLMPRFMFGLLDQGLHSLTTLTVLVCVARVATVGEVASLTLALVILYSTMSIVRSCGTGTLMVLFGGDRLAVQRHAPFARTLALIGSMLASAAATLVLMVREDLSLALPFAFAATMQLMLDAERYLLVASARLQLAANLALVQFLAAPAGILFVVYWPDDMRPILYAWGAAAGVAAGLGRVLEGFASAGISRLSDSLAILWRAMSYLSLEALGLALSTQFVLVLIAAYMSDADLAGFRLSTSVVLGPISTLFMGLLPQFQMAVRRWWLANPGGPARLRSVVSGAMITLTPLLWSAFFMLLPTSVLDFLAGESAEASRGMLWQAALVMAGTSGCAVWWMYLRYSRGLRRVAVQRTVVTFAALGLFWIGLWLSVGGAFALYAVALIVPPLLLMALPEPVGSRGSTREAHMRNGAHAAGDHIDT